MNTQNKLFRLTRRGSYAPGRVVMILMLLAALAPAVVLQAQQLPAGQQEPNAGVSGRRGGSPTTRPATGFPGGPRGLGSVPLPQTPVLGEGPTCTFDAIIYDVRIPAEQIGRLDVAALAKAATAADGFETALAALGTARPMYFVGQSVRLSGDTISIGAQMPYVSNSNTSARGLAMHTVSYMHTGANFSLAGKAEPAGRIDLDLSIEVSSFLDSGLAIGDAKAPISHSATLSHKGPVQPRKPFIVVTVDAGSLDKDGKALAYIARVTVGDPQAPTPR